MVAIKTMVIAGVITVICVTALVVGIVLGTRSYGCSISEPPTEVTVTHSATGTTISWAIHEGEEECEGAYRLGYEIEDGPSVRQNFTDLEELSWTIDPLEPCSVLHVHIWPITKDGEVMSEHFMEEFSVPLENLDAPTNVQINEEEGGLEVLWNAPANVGNCADKIQYEVTVVRDGESSTEDLSSATSYTIEDSSYCFEVTISIVAIHEDESSAAVAGTFQAPPIENIATIQSTDDPTQLVISWDPHPKADICGIEYRVVYRRGGQEFVVTAETATLSIELDYCVETELSVAAFNGEHSTEVGSSSGIIYPTQIDALTDLAITEGVISWTAPAVPETCTVTYVLNFDTDARQAQFNTIETTFAVPDDIYCFRYFVQVVPVLGEQSGIGENNLHTDDSGVGILQVEAIGEQLTATWDAHPKATQCSLQYALTYSVDGVVQHTDLVSENTVSFNRFFCVEGEVSVVATNSDGLNSSPSTATVEADYPSNVDPVTNLGNSDGYLTWTSISAPLGCEVTYILELSGDLGIQNYNSVYNTYTIPPGDYCFEANVNVIALIGEIRSTSVAVNIDAALQVGTVTIVPVLSNNEILVSWPVHSKQDQCGITYDATYSYGSMENQAPIRSDQETAVFSLGYCVEGTVTVTAVASVVTATTSNTGAHISVTPTTIGPVQDLTAVSTPDNQITIFWYPPLYVSQCENIEYEVTATDRESPANSNSCSPTTDSTSCVVTEFCPTTDITIIATYPDTTDVIGEEATHVHTCDTSSGEEDSENTI